MPEFLGKEGNKLLKLIEEPPADTIFIFVAEDESQILPTILSRTQLIKIPCLTDKEIEEALISRAATDQTRARQIAGICDGNYREALQILQHAEEDWQGLAREWLNAILKTGPAAQIKWIDEISRLGRERQKQFLRYFVHLLQQAIRIKVTSGIMNVPMNENDFASRLNKIAELPAQEAMIKEFEKAIGYIERNAHGKMLFHALTIRVYHIIKDNSLILIH
jgi:DNA polymerase-3 subunit delta'